MVEAVAMAELEGSLERLSRLAAHRPGADAEKIG